MLSLYFHCHFSQKQFFFYYKNVPKIKKSVSDMQTTSEPHKLSPRKVQVYGRSYSENSSVEEIYLQFENPEALKVKDCLYHVLCCTDFNL